MTQPLLMPKTKLPVDQATVKDLEYWADRIEKEVGEGASKFPAQDAERAKAMRGELARRKAGGKPAQPQAAPQRQAIAPHAPSQLVIGTFGNADTASKALLAAAQQYHLVSPATVVGRLPEGCEVVISMVQIDPNSSDVYVINGNRDHPADNDVVGIDRVGLQRIAGAMGVTWISSKRTDDGTHPHYCAWEAWAEYPGFDLQPQRVPGNVDIDTREDGELRGAAAEEIRRKAEGRERGDGGDKQLLELRKFITRHAESKAMNRAIGNRGIKRSYKRHELKRPFAVARLMFTGHSDDPEARREFRQMIGQRFLGATQQLYGVQPSAPALQMAAPAPQLHAPPPLTGRAPQQDYDHDADGEPMPESDRGAPSGQQPASDATDQQGSRPSADGY